MSLQLQHVDPVLLSWPVLRLIFAISCVSTAQRFSYEIKVPEHAIKNIYSVNQAEIVLHGP